MCVMLSVYAALTGHASCYIKLTDTEKECVRTAMAGWLHGVCVGAC